MADLRAQLNRARDAAGDLAGSAGEKIKDSSSKARDSAGELIQTSRDKAGEVYGDARDRTQRAATRANEIVQEHPIVAVAGAVAAGALIAWMFPKSRAAIKALPGVATTVGARVAEAALAARDAAAERAEAVKNSASQTLHNAKESASSGAASVRDSVAASDLPAKASRLGDEVIAVIGEKVDALSDAVKARLPKK